MEKQQIFRVYGEQQAADHTAIQAYARQSLDHIVFDAVTASRRYAGLNVIKSAQAEIQIAPGRFYDVDGAVYNIATTTTQSMASYTAPVAQRWVLICAYGVVIEIEPAPRKYLINPDDKVNPPIAESRTLNMTSARACQIEYWPGNDSPDPQLPGTPSGRVAIAKVLMDSVQVVSITMLTDNEVTSTEELGTRLDAVEAFDAATGPRISSLASDLAALTKKVNAGSTQLDIVRLFTDVAEMREKLKLPATYAQYGADYFLDNTHSDDTNAASLGYDADVENGVRFPAANEDAMEISLFAANDPNASTNSGLLLPKFTPQPVLTIATYHEDVGISQYGYQTFNLKQNKIRKERLRYGGQYMRCTNGVQQWTQAGNSDVPYWLPDFETYETATQIDNGNPWHLVTYYDYWWHDSWTETYWTLETVDHTITGAQVAQTFLVSNDIWACRLGFYVNQKAAEENIIVDLCEITNGAPDLSKVILHQVHAAADIVTGWNRIDIVPTFLERGKRYAMVLTSNANHRLGVAYGQSYLDGTMFYSTDGVYYLGDLMKDLMIEVWGAKFAASQVTIEFAPINLDNGLRSIDITAGTIVPEACQLIYEIRPNGVGDWQPLTPQNTSVLGGATPPPLCWFRARFVGTRDIQPGIMLTGSRVYVSRPKLAFKHVSDDKTVPSTTKIHVRTVIEGFDDTPHDFSAKLRIAGADVNPSATVDTVLDAGAKRVQRDFSFESGFSATTSFRIMLIGATNSAQSVFHVAESLYYVLTS